VEPNPAAIAWYVEEAQRLLEDQQRRAESLRARAGQIAGFGAAVFALIGGNAATILGATAQESDDAVAVAITNSLYSFLAGLGFSLMLLGTLILELI
jgi:hypothetical protein